MELSAELRWWWQDECPADVEEWFRRNGLAPGGGAPGRRDRYFHQPGKKELGIKVRAESSQAATQQLEIKGLVSEEVGHQLWCKWKSAAVRAQDDGIVVVKQRWLRKFSVGEAVTEIELDANENPRDGGDRPVVGCNVELTRVEIEGRTGLWWTIGFEAFGTLKNAPKALSATLSAARTPQFDGQKLSYPEWLDQFAQVD